MTSPTYNTKDIRRILKNKMVGNLLDKVEVIEFTQMTKVII